MNRFTFIEDHHHAWGVKRLCHVLEAARSSFYTWRAGRQARAARERADAALAERVRTVHAERDGTYGRPRITAELRDGGECVNHKRVGRVMRKYGIAGLRLRKRQVTTVPEPSAAPVPDLFRRDFTGTAPNTKFGARCAKTAATSSWCQNRLRPSVCATAGKPLSGLLLQSLIRGLLVPNSDTICAVSTSRSAGEI